MKTLLFGKDGQLGQDFIPAMKCCGELLAVGRRECDLTHAEQIQGVIRQFKPNLIINASAYTAVDQAQNDSELAGLINTQAPTVMAKEASSLGAAFVHYSTDYVFDGLKAGTYDELDDCHPLSVYGLSKFLGEEGVRAHCLRHLIFRTSWVFSAHGSNFLKTIIKLAEIKEELSIIDDQLGAPTPTSLLVAITMTILKKNGIVQGDQRADSEELELPSWGLFNLVALGETSWHNYAHYIVRRCEEIGLADNFLLDASKISPIPSKDYPQLAPRPLNSRLNTTKIQRTFKLQLPDWRVGVDQELDKIKLARETKKI